MFCCTISNNLIEITYLYQMLTFKFILDIKFLFHLFRKLVIHAQFIGTIILANNVDLFAKNILIVVTIHIKLQQPSQHMDRQTH